MKRLPDDELEYIAKNDWIGVNAAPLAAEILTLRKQNQQLMEQLAFEAKGFYKELEIRERKAEERGAAWMLEAIQFSRTPAEVCATARQEVVTKKEG